MRLGGGKSLHWPFIALRPDAFDMFGRTGRHPNGVEMVQQRVIGCARLDDAASSGNHHTVVIFDDAGDGLFLIAAKPVLPVERDNLTDSHPADRLNLA